MLIMLLVFFYWQIMLARICQIDLLIAKRKTVLHCSLEYIFVISLYFCSYASLIADWPVVVLGMCTVFIVVCALVGILVPELPDFSDPLLVRKIEQERICLSASLAQSHFQKVNLETIRCIIFWEKDPNSFGTISNQ